MKLVDLTGKRFGRLVVLSRAQNAGHHLRWNCSCVCGTDKAINSSHLRTGHTTSCGCIASETTAARNIAAAKHGMWKTPEFAAWLSMIKRCHKPKAARYADYGGRGIAVCEAWKESFQSFFDDVGLRPSPLHSLDRMRNNEGYSPGNVRWATDIEQNNNKRSNVVAVVAGRSMTVAEIARAYGLAYGTVWNRVRDGKSEAEIIAPSRRAK